METPHFESSVVWVWVFDGKPCCIVQYFSSEEHVRLAKQKTPTLPAWADPEMFKKRGRILMMPTQIEFEGGLYHSLVYALWFKIVLYIDLPLYEPWKGYYRVYSKSPLTKFAILKAGVLTPSTPSLDPPMLRLTFFIFKHGKQLIMTICWSCNINCKINRSMVTVRKIWYMEAAK